jgi:hypothetical protein
MLRITVHGRRGDHWQAVIPGERERDSGTMPNANLRGDSMRKSRPKANS